MRHKRNSFSFCNENLLKINVQTFMKGTTVWIFKRGVYFNLPDKFDNYSES